MTKKGYKMTQAHKEKIRKHHLSMGIKHWANRPEIKAKLIKTLRHDYWLGKKRPDISGINHYLYNPNKPINLQLKYSLKYRQWRSDIFQRDNWTCQFCNIRGIILEAHHIKAFSKIIKENKIKTFEEGLNCEELWNINNGQTLCLNCHKKTDNYLLKAKLK